MKSLKNLLTALLIVSLLVSSILALSACGDKGGNEDEGGASSEGEGADGGGTQASKVSFTLNLKDQRGNSVPGVEITLNGTDGNQSASGVTASDGTLTLSLYAGKYSVTYGELPLYHLPSDASEVTVGAEGGSATLILTNSTPDGSKEYPLFLADTETTVTVKAGGEFWLFTRGVEKMLRVKGEGLKAVIAGVEYETVDGELTAPVPATESNYAKVDITIKNEGSADVSATVSFEFLPGTMDNPYELTLGTDCAPEVAPESTVYFTLTAPKTGILQLKGTDTDNRISLYNLNSYRVTATTEGLTLEYLYLHVSEGDVIQVSVGNASEEAITAGFSATVVEGSEAEPLELTAAGAALPLKSGESRVFSYKGEAGALRFDGGVTVLINGAAVEQGASVSADDVITVTNAGTESVECALSVTVG